MSTAAAANRGTLLSKLTKIDPKVVQTMHRSTYADRVDTRYLQSPIDVAARYQVIPATFPAQDVIWNPS